MAREGGTLRVYILPLSAVRCAFVRFSTFTRDFTPRVASAIPCGVRITSPEQRHVAQEVHVSPKNLRLGDVGVVLVFSLLASGDFACHGIAINH